MTEPVTALLIILGFLINLAAARFFKTLDAELMNAWQTPVIAGAVAGVVLRVSHASNPVAIGVVITAVVLYVRLMGHETEPVDGMMLGACSGAVAALPLIIRSDTPCRPVATCILAGAVAGFGVTVAAQHIVDRTRRYVIDLVTAVLAMGAAAVPLALSAAGVNDCTVALISAASVPVFVVIVVFHQWPDVRAELTHEASLGFMADADIRRTAHPLMRLGRGGWSDASAHRVFVRVANQIALRKRQQRTRSAELARLYQLEIIKLRMQMEAMSRINREARGEEASDTMAQTK